MVTLHIVPTHRRHHNHNNIIINKWQPNAHKPNLYGLCGHCAPLPAPASAHQLVQ